MRAGRLVNMLLILQRRGRLTANAIGGELGVSPRTVLRDVQALNEAGIPVFTSQGAGGGIELVGGFRTVLTGFTTEDALALLLLGQPAVARQLGMAEAAESARRKVLQSLSPQLRHDAEELDSWFVADPGGWSAERVASKPPTPESEKSQPEKSEPQMLDRLAEATRLRRGAELNYGTERVTVLPLGLVVKAGSWFVVEQTRSGPGARCLDGLLAVRVTASAVERPEHFDLADCWAEMVRTGMVRAVVSGQP